MQVLDRTGVGTLWSICKTKFALAGHTHNYAGSGSAGGSANSAISVVDYGQTSKKIQIGYAGSGITGEQIKYIAGYTSGSGDVNAKIKDVSKEALRSWLGLGTLAYSSATITDNKVTQNAVKSSDYTNWRSLVFSAANSATEGFTPSTTTDGVFIANTLSVQPSSGTIKANKFKGALEGNASTASNASTVNGHTVNANVPSNAKFTDTNTWRPIQDNLTSTSTSESLSANQGRVLKGLVDGKANSSHTHSWSQISGAPATANRWPSWGEVTGKPGSFTPSSHTHDWSQVTDKPDLEYIVPTLSNIPTSSTLTFVENGVTKHFKIGYMCRVADSSAEHGYKFYQLYNISNGKATWGNISDNGGDYSETITVVLTSTLSSSDSKLNGAIVTVKNTINEETHIQTQTWNGTPLVFKIPAVNTYTVNVSRVSGYVTPVELYYTAGVGTSKSVAIAYKYIPVGIYIYDTDGNFTKADDWNTSNNGKVVGVSVRTENSMFVISPDYYSSGRKQWGGYGKTISGIVTSNDSVTAKKDYAGELNTDKIVAQLGIGKAHAAEYCRSLTFKNGKKGYLWSLGEAQDAYNNKKAIDAAMRKIGGTDIQTDYYLWTSTQYSNYTAYGMYWSDGYVDDRNKENENYVRAVCAL